MPAGSCDELFERWKDYATRLADHFAKTVCGAELGELEDVRQTAMVTLLECLQKYAEESETGLFASRLYHEIRKAVIRGANDGSLIRTANRKSHSLNRQGSHVELGIGDGLDASIIQCKPGEDADEIRQAISVALDGVLYAQILRMLFGVDGEPACSQEEAAKRIGCSRSQLGRMKDVAMDALRAELEALGYTEEVLRLARL